MIKELKKQLKQDPELFYSWQSNIAMQFVDECSRFKKLNKKRVLSCEDIHTIANESAKNFLNMLIKE